MKDASKLRTYQRRMLNNPTPHETLFCEKLKQRNFEFKQQMILGFYIIDFVLPKYMLCFEIDGSSHDKRKEYDRKRDRFIESLGFNVIHIKNKNVAKYILSNITSRIFEQKVFRSALAKANSLRSIAKQRDKKKDIVYKKIKKNRKKVNNRMLNAIEKQREEINFIKSKRGL